MKPGDRLVCAFVELPAKQFKGWPLHVTIVPWFRTGISSEQLKAELESCLGNIEPFGVAAAETKPFGHRKQANLIAPPTPFMEIERRVRIVLKRHDAWLVDETTREKRPYSPHVTVQPAARLNSGDIFACDKLYIIEQLGDSKRITSTIELGTKP